MAQYVTEYAGFAARELLTALNTAGLPSSYTYQFHEGNAWFGLDRSFDHRVGTVLPDDGPAFGVEPSPWGDYAWATPNLADCVNNDRLCDVCVCRPGAGGSCPAYW